MQDNVTLIKIISFTQYNNIGLGVLHRGKYLEKSMSHPIANRNFKISPKAEGQGTDISRCSI